MMKSTKNQDLRNLICDLTTNRMIHIQELAKRTGQIDEKEFLLCYELWLEVAPDEAIEKVRAQLEKADLLNIPTAIFRA